MTSTSTPSPPSNDDEEITYLTPRKNNCFKRRETHPKVEPRHFLSDDELQQQHNGIEQVHNPLHQDLNQGIIDTNLYHNIQQNLAFQSNDPLSWQEARRRLKCTLELWKRDEKNRVSQSALPNYRFLSLENLDIILAIVLCIAFVILSFTLPAQSDLPESFILMQRIAAVLFLVSSLASASILNRWAAVRERDQSIERRRCVTSFLKEMECIHEKTVSTDGSGGEHVITPTDAIPRKNVEDVYSTYRLNNTKCSDSGNPHPGAWHRIPTLLLVQGDHIALKVGDTCPAKCKSTKNQGCLITVNAGERLTLDLLGSHHLKFPAGKSTVKADDDILMLANGVQVFEMLETPLESFLNNEDTSASSKPPQLLRQGQSVRAALLPAAFITFLFTSSILLARPSVGHQNIFTSSIWTIPILAALCFLPMTTPMFLFLLECIGTARILATVHPWASNQKQSIEHGVYGKICSDDREMMKTPSWLVCRYIAATLRSRLQSSAHNVSRSLLTIPPASMHLLEKLGLVTAITLVDDELACEPHSTPQQLLIPSKDGGLKILDLCPAFSEEDEYSTDSEEIEQTNNHSSRSSTQLRRSLDMMATDLDSDDEDVYETRFAHSFSAPARSLRKKLKKRYNRKRSSSRAFWFGVNKKNSQAYPLLDDADVQFEDPNWWQFLPSLKCIGLSCMLIESKDEKYPVASKEMVHNPNPKVAFNIETTALEPRISAETKLLVNHLCMDRERSQLRVLAKCIGFSTSPNELGNTGDMSSFLVRRRLHIISSDLLRNRMNLKYHAMGLEESRNWSRLYTDADTIFVKDGRSGGDLVLTVGDARVVTSLSPDWWQGENSTISPLTASDRQIIIETQNNWMLSDLDVQAFSYAPLPYTADQKIGFGLDGDHVYLLDNASEQGAATGGFWSLVKNQIFLGLLGSSVRPRKEIEPLITASNDAGVRFVYFSPRNMRRTKELASQMGIDVAWNCAISLRPLDEGEDDLYRMTSNYADWDVNARLPHGVDDVKRHLEEVDNVPLLVSIYTDVTKMTTADMVNVFQNYHDTVLSVGLSHLPCNHEIFSRADIAIGVDVFSEECLSKGKSITNANALFPAEISFIASISSHSSVFNLWGSRSTCHLVEIIRIGRASLEAASSSAMFFLSGLLSFGIFLIFCPCTVSTVVPTIPALEAFLYVQIILHGIGLSMASTDGNKEQMTRVPQKNDVTTTYSFKESMKWYRSLLLRSVSSSISSHLIYLVSLGELMWALDPIWVEEHCLLDGYIKERTPLAAIIRCQDLEQYSGISTIAAGSISLASLALCNTVLSASFVFRTESIRIEPPWKQNHQWVGSVIISVILISAYLLGTLEREAMLVLPWYFYVMFVLCPFICLGISEMVKQSDAKQERRAAMMRRLQFETRLGMWSPKESTHIVEHVNTRVDAS